MCGIFGVIAKKDCTINTEYIKNIFLDVAKYSETRGKDSSGIAFRNEFNKEYNVIKGPIPISSLLLSKEFKTKLSEVIRFSSNGSKSKRNIAIIGHARLTTNGTQLKDINNQPVVKDGLIGIHNGIIVNVEELWNKNKDLKRSYDIDTEVMLALFRRYLTIYNDSKYAIIKTAKDINGTIAAAIFMDDRDELVLITNNGSLHILTNDKDLFIFASEHYILEKLSSKFKLLKNQSEYHLNQLHPKSGKILNLKQFGIETFDYNYSINRTCLPNKNVKYSIKSENIGENRKQASAIVDISTIGIHKRASYERKLLEYNYDKISEIRRCKKCLLPETFPFIKYDEDGICVICNNTKPKNQTKPLDELIELLSKYKRNNGEPDCIVPYSGGRDSTYTLHIVKKILHMNPIAFTYDWGMVTDLARRNIARVCGKLGVENIIVSADIQWKRENIRKNIIAWLKNPNIGMIPLFMAGDKYFFYYTSQIKKQTGIKLNVWGTNPLENTDFKVGFCGLPLRFNKKYIYSLKIIDQIQLFYFVGKNILKNPSYINQSLFDSFGSFLTRYVGYKKDMYHMFDYYKWNEKEVEELITSEYNWETAVDTKSTWRIGDGTSAFYNYVYYTITGFSEYDTFRSNQIREGMLERDKALSMVNIENKPRYESIKWYTEILGLDFEDVIKKINSIPKLY